MSEVSVSENEAENPREDWIIVNKIQYMPGIRTQDLSIHRQALYPYTTTTALYSALLLGRGLLGYFEIIEVWFEINHCESLVAIFPSKN